MIKLTPEEFKLIKEEIQTELKTILDVVRNIVKNANEQKTYTKQLAIQNSILKGFIKLHGMEEEYSKFSKDFTEWDINESESNNV